MSGGKTLQRPKGGKRMLLLESEVIRNEGRTSPRWDLPAKQGLKEGIIEEMVVLSDSAEEHERPHPEPTFKGIPMTLDASMQNEQRLGRTLIPR